MKKLWILLLLASSTLATAQQGGKALLWKISGKGLNSPSYLFGTYHLLGDSYLNSHPEIQQAFQQTQGLVVELVLDSAELPKTYGMVVMKEDRLSRLVTPQQYRKLDSVFASVVKIPLSNFEQLLPNLVAQQLVMEYMRQNCTIPQEIPMDMAFTTRAKSAGKSVVALETLTQQFMLLFQMESAAEQAKSLMQVVDQFASLQQNACKMTEFYQQGNLEALDKLARDGSLGPPLPDWMLERRNIDWMTKIPALIKQKPHFIAVGALHLTGKEGLIQLLRNQGFNVEPVPFSR